MEPLAIISIVCAVLVLLVAIYQLVSNRKWWAAVFALCALLSFIILVIELPIGSAGTSTLLPIYIIVMCCSLMLLAIAMVCGSVRSSAKAGSMGTVGVLIMVYALAMVLIMPFVHLYYRAFIVSAVVLTTGILFGGTLSGLYSFFGRNSIIGGRRYGHQSVSHALYYLSMAAIATASKNCDSISDFSSLLGVGVLSASVATIGVLAEGNAWTSS